MGSMIHLGIGRLELDWGKNSFFRNHSALFTRNDVGSATYYYADGVTETREAFVRPLRSVVRRLDLLGYTMRQCERRYQDTIDDHEKYHSMAALSFEDFVTILGNVNVNDVAVPEDGDYDPGEFVQKAIMADPEFARSDIRLANLTQDHGLVFENLDPYVTLRVLAENPRNLDEQVIWRYADVLEGGYVDEDEIYEGVTEADICLVVTEGSSDSAILRHALPVVAPDVADFFNFIDMSENYPFTGTGNLYRFCQGLARIRIQNRILVVLDNDTSGREAHQRISALELPPRMNVAILPDLEECRRMRTIGPSGEQIEDVNGRAVAIECFLDLTQFEGPIPTVRWTAYNADLDAYQGELIKKDEYTRRFLKVGGHRGGYDYSKLADLWHHLLVACCSTDP